MGVTSANADCCDVDGNANHNQTAYFTAPDACDGDGGSLPFDYNCDGVEEQQINGPTGCLANFSCVLGNDGVCLVGPVPADCGGQAEDVNTAACGTMYGYASKTCQNVSIGVCMEVDSSGLLGVQACH